MKPSNIMITLDGQVKVLDFGLAKLTQVPEPSSPGERLTLDDRIVGTPPYLSPEQALCEKVDARSDIFSLGAILYEMFTGKRPFERAANVEMLSAIVNERAKETAIGRQRDLPARLEKVVAKCLEKSTERRYQSMEDVRNALEDLRHSDTSERLLATRGSHSAASNRMLWRRLRLAVVLAAAGGLPVEP